MFWISCLADETADQLSANLLGKVNEVYKSDAALLLLRFVLKHWRHVILCFCSSMDSSPLCRWPRPGNSVYITFNVPSVRLTYYYYGFLKFTNCSGPCRQKIACVWLATAKSASVARKVSLLQCPGAATQAAHAWTALAKAVAAVR